MMKKVQRDDFFRVLGIVDEDLFSGNLNFVFGIAQTPKFTKFDKVLGCLISLVRLKQDFYGGDSNPKLFRERALKEAIHELGHTFGLEHCHNVCVMRFSNSLPETDDKPSRFCKNCREQLKSHF
jgi:archaemetzincin